MSSLPGSTKCLHVMSGWLMLTRLQLEHWSQCRKKSAVGITCERKWICTIAMCFYLHPQLILSLPNWFVNELWWRQPICSNIHIHNGYNIQPSSYGVRFVVYLRHSMLPALCHTVLLLPFYSFCCCFLKCSNLKANICHVYAPRVGMLSKAHMAPLIGWVYSLSLL